MTTTGYSDTFNRTVSNGLGSATSGQAYTLSSPATMYSVAPSTANITPSTAGDKIGVVDLQAQSVDITAQVALSAIPATNLATAGFIGKFSTTANYYNGTMMVATGGAISLRFSKVIGGGTTTISTTATGLTYVANTFYNLRYRIYWSRSLQTNVMALKLWAVGGTEPGGWMAVANDAALTDYTSGTQVGIMGRDESTVVGTITAKYRSVLALSYNLPVPATTDPMCADPAVTYPKQTALQSLALAADSAMAAIDPLTSLAGLFPRVRISNSNLALTAPLGFSFPTFSATEFNVGTGTNLGYNNRALSLGVGIWLVTFEILLAEAASDFIQMQVFGGITGITADMRSNPVQLNDGDVGGCGHASLLIPSTDPTTPITVTVSLVMTSGSTYTAKYMALSAVKISDYFS